MADRLSSEQIQEVAALLGDAGKNATTCRDLVSILRTGRQSAFAEADIDSIASATSALEVPLEKRPRWFASATSALEVPPEKRLRCSVGPCNERGHFFVFEGLDRSG